jgi:hypothetical protein
VVLVALVIVVGAMAWRSHAAQAEAQAQTASLRREIARLTGTLTAQPGPPMAERALLESRYLSWLMTFQSAQDWREGARIADDLAALSPADSTAILQKIFAAIRMPEVRQQILKAFALRGGRPNALPILHLGILDSDAEVRQWARNYLRSYAWRIFASDQEALLWSTKFAIHPIEDVLEISTAEFMNRLDKSAPLDEFALLHTIDLQVLDKFGSAPVRSNVRGTLTRWIQKHGAEWDEELQQHAAREALHFALYTGQLPPAVRAYTARLREQR